MSFPVLWVYSVHRPELVVSSKEPDKKKTSTASKSVDRKITKQSFSLIWAETASAKPLVMSLLLLVPSPLKLGGSAQNSQNPPEYRRIVRVEVSGDSSSNRCRIFLWSGTPTPRPHCCNGEQLHRQKSLSVWSLATGLGGAWQASGQQRGDIKPDFRALMATLLQKGL